MLDSAHIFQDPTRSKHCLTYELSASPHHSLETHRPQRSDQRVVHLQDRGALRRKSKRLAAICKKSIHAFGYYSVLKILSENHVNEPLSEGGKQSGKVARVCCSEWWLRQLKKQSERKCEHSAIKAGLVCRGRSLYISKTLFLHIEAKRKASVKAAEQIEAVNVDTGETLEMSKILKGSISNPDVRLAEFMVRCRGYEKYANKQGHIAVFCTLTAPSKYHAVLSNKDTKKTLSNFKYNGVTPSDTQAYLNSLWKRIRAKLNRDGLKIYGYRVCEPHHDGTPHWHLMLFMKKSDAKSVSQIMKKYSLIEDGDEPGALEHRFTEKVIDPRKGSATGYISKYISKNTNGSHVDIDHESGLSGSDAADRVRAWASVWSIRQFQMIGGAPVSVWRELRRISKCPDGLLEQARQAADSGDWEQYLRLQGGIDTRRKSQPIKCYKVKRIDRKTGNYITNKYGELVDKIEGVKTLGDQSVQTRMHEWTLQRKQPESKPFQQGSFTGLVSAESPIIVDLDGSISWSTVNNCTQQATSSDLIDCCSKKKSTPALFVINLFM